MLDVETIKLYFTGIYKTPNMSVGAIIVKKNAEVIYQESLQFVADCSEEAHYLALQIGLKWIVANNYDKYMVRIYGDSLTVIRQLRGKWHTHKETYCKTVEDVFSDIKRFPLIHYKWIREFKNRKVIELARKN